MSQIKSLGFCIPLSLLALTGKAQPAKRPAVVLVQLSAETNRKAALEKDRRYKELQEVSRDAKKVMNVTISDFHDRFTYCPVYYFVDTNLEAVKNKHFEGILINADGSAVTAPPVSKENTNYIIVYYGYPTRPEKTRKDGDDLASTPGRGLVVLNSDYQQIGYSINPDFVSFSRVRKEEKEKYFYESKHFNIQYLPYAKALSDQLENNSGSFKGSVKEKK